MTRAGMSASSTRFNDQGISSSYSPYDKSYATQSRLLSEPSPGGGAKTSDEMMALSNLDAMSSEFDPHFIQNLKAEIYPNHNYKVIAAFKVYNVDRNKQQLIENLNHLHNEI